MCLYLRVLDTNNLSFELRLFFYSGLNDFSLSLKSLLFIYARLFFKDITYDKFSIN